jgi:hypothetical protein
MIRVPESDMSRDAYPRSRSRQAQSIAMSILVWSGFRRWLSRPWQCSLRDYLVIVATCAAGLWLWGFPTPLMILLATLGGAIFVALRLPRHGFKLTDVATLLAIILLTAAIVLQAMEQAKNGTAGKPPFPSIVPARLIILIAGS